MMRFKDMNSMNSIDYYLHVYIYPEYKYSF